MLTVLMLSASLTQAHFTGEVAVSPAQEPTFLGILLAPWFNKDLLDKAIENQQTIEVERIIASREFTQKEKDHYLKTARENIVKTKPNLEPRLNPCDVAHIGAGALLTAASAVGFLHSGSAVLTLIKRLTGSARRSQMARVNPLMDLGAVPVISAVAGYYGLKFLNRYVKGFYPQQAYDKALAINELVAAIKVKA